MRTNGLGILAFLLVGCGAPARPAPQVPVAPAAPGPAAAAPTTAPKPVAAAAPADPFRVPDGPRDDAPVVPLPGVLSFDGWIRARSMKGVGPLPASCRAFVGRAPAKTKPASLAVALAESDVAKRDALLVARQADEPPGVVRALRADLAPVECADALVDPAIEELVAAGRQKATTGPLGHLLVGLSLASKLARTAHDPPKLPGTADKAKVKAFYDGPMKEWVIEQATLIEALGSTAAGLEGYGRGVAAIEAGHADLRLVDQVRNGPVPKGWDAELREVYEAALDQALEPRKQRGRDATLVGLSDLVDTGVIVDERASRARGLLAKLYAGRRIDALEGLLLPPKPVYAVGYDAERAALHVSTFWLDFDAKSVTGTPAGATLAVALLRGVPRTVRVKARTGKLDTAPPAAYARARIDLGTVGLRRMDFVEAAHALAGSKAPEDRLLLAVAIALASGPNGARALMTAPSPAALGFDRLEALDALAADGGPYAGMAAYDAAHLRALTTPEGDAAAPWLDDVAARFRKASALLPAPEQKALAAKRAADAEATRDAMQKR